MYYCNVLKDSSKEIRCSCIQAIIVTTLHTICHSWRGRGKNIRVTSCVYQNSQKCHSYHHMWGSWHFKVISITFNKLKKSRILWNDLPASGSLDVGVRHQPDLNCQSVNRVFRVDCSWTKQFSTASGVTTIDFRSTVKLPLGCRSRRWLMQSQYFLTFTSFLGWFLRTYCVANITVCWLLVVCQYLGAG